METALEVLSRAATMVNAASGEYLNKKYSFEQMQWESVGFVRSTHCVHNYYQFL